MISVEAAKVPCRVSMWNMNQGRAMRVMPVVARHHTILTCSLMSSCLFYTDCNPEMPVVYYLMVISCLLLHLSLDELVWRRAPKVSQILSEGNKLKE